MELYKKIPFVLASNDYHNIQEYIKHHHISTGVRLDFTYFNEEEFYQERQYPFYTALIFEYGFRNPDKPVTKQEIEYMFWHLV